MTKEINPIIIGVDQYKQKKDIKNPLDPLSLILRSVKGAIKNTNSKKIVDFIDKIFMVNINSWSYEDAPEVISKDLGINLEEKVYLADGGNTPQMLVNRACKEISKEIASSILICGGEAAYSLYQSKKGKRNLNWPEKKRAKSMEGNIWHGINEFENRYKLIVPSYSYAIFETALRFFKKRSISEQNQHIGDLFHKFSKIAAKNPYAWNNRVFNSEEIIQPSPENRLINHPYTKRMCSNMFVDQSAAIIITTENIAKRLGIPKEYWIYPMGGSDYENIFSICQRPNLYSSPAARYGSQEALKQAGISISEIYAFDIYSCFHSIIEIIKDEIGLSENDERDLTITGGLPYFGGPWSNYSLHAIATAVERIREDPKRKIMVIANGGYNTKQSFGIYGSEKGYIPWSKKKEINEIQNSIFSKSLEKPVIQSEGILVIEGYTLIYNREGKPKRGIFLGSLKGTNRKTLAFSNQNQKKIEEIEFVGKEFQIHYDKDLECNIISIEQIL